MDDVNVPLVVGRRERSKEGGAKAPAEDRDESDDFVVELGPGSDVGDRLLDAGTDGGGLGALDDLCDTCTFTSGPFCGFGRSL